MIFDLSPLLPLASFRHALRRFLAASERISRDGGVTQHQYQAMLAIAARLDARMSMKELSEELLLTHHAAVQLMDRLAKLGLAQRSPSSVDRRSVELSLTENGTALVNKLASQHLAEMLLREPALSASLRQLRQLRSATDPDADRC